MKTTRKVLAVLLAVVLTFALAVTAFAADAEYSITVKNDNGSLSIDGITYSAYKLFDVTRNGDAYAYSISSNSYWYKNAMDVLDDYFTFTAQADDPTIYNVRAIKDADGKSIIDDAAARALADALQQFVAGAKADATAEADGEEAIIELATDGYYIVTGTAVANENADEIVTAAIALNHANPNPVVNVKADAPTIDKFIQNSDATGADGKGTAVDVGSVVDFVLYSATPVMTGYKTYEFIVHDTLSANLALDKNSFKVTIGKDEVTDFTVADGDDGETFTLTIADLTKYEGDIVITYSATLTEGAVETAEETNTVYLEYSCNPYTDDTAETVPYVVYVYDFDIDIEKYDAEDETNKLSGAKFVLYKVVEEAKKYYAVSEDGVVSWVDKIDDATVVETDTNGFGEFCGVDSGEYFIHETEAPDGYLPLEEDLTVTIEAEYDEKGIITYTFGGTGVSNVSGNGQFIAGVAVPNDSEGVIPYTGGMGTTLFYVCGAILLLGAAVVLITKKRVSTEK